MSTDSELPLVASRSTASVYVEDGLCLRSLAKSLWRTVDRQARTLVLTSLEFLPTIHTHPHPFYPFNANTGSCMRRGIPSPPSPTDVMIYHHGHLVDFSAGDYPCPFPPLGSHTCLHTHTEIGRAKTKMG